MSYELNDFAKQHFMSISDRKHRERIAEQKLIQLYFDESTEGTYVEVGANEPKSTSMTWHLEELGWTGLLIEPIPELCEALRRERPNSKVYEVACSAPGEDPYAEFMITPDMAQSCLKANDVAPDLSIERVARVRVQTLDEVLADAKLSQLDFLSIDVEGLQLDVLQGLSMSLHRPRLLLIEDHLVNLKTHAYLVGQGYKLYKRTGLNNWYLPKGTRFRLTSLSERLALLGKLLRTPIRRIKFAMKRRRMDAAKS
jgi:FkbM family methyltransferase